MVNTYSSRQSDTIDCNKGGGSCLFIVNNAKLTHLTVVLRGISEAGRPKFGIEDKSFSEWFVKSCVAVRCVEDTGTELLGSR